MTATDSTQGYAPRRGSEAWRRSVELLSSMRFAIALLTVICIASVIGTVIKQHEPAVNYTNQFGPFWAELFLAVKLNAVYSAWWFLLILAFLVISTSLCIARSAIVLICLGGLFDGDLFVRALTWVGGKTVYSGGGLVSDVKPEHRLPASNPTFRGNLVVSEGTASSTAILAQSDGILLQELPFAVELKKFIVEYYSTGMPKLFASDIVIHDLETGAKQDARVEVNHPASFKGINIYQSSFDDGGSSVKLRAVPMNGHAQPFEIDGTIGGASQITNGDDKLTLELTALRVINVENLSDDRPGAASGADVRKVDLGHALTQRLGAADKTVTQRQLRNVGPSITYKLRDAAGQAREFHNYMLPVDTGDGAAVFLLGVRNTPAEQFRYLRVPADDEGNIDGFVRLRAALQDAAQRERAVRRYVAKAVDPARPELGDQLAASAARALGLFAGAEEVKGQRASGLQAISDFMEAAVPEAERERAAEVLLRILNGSLYELNALAREGAGLKPLPESEATQRYMTQAVLALSDAPLYPAPMAFELKDFKQVQASVFQVARAPGQNVVYLGCLLLILGVFAMLYIRERRLWVWLAPEGADGSRATMALSSNRKLMDTDREFDHLRQKLLHEQPEGAKA